MSSNKKTQNISDASSENLDWAIIQKDMKNKLGNDIYESWLRKIDFVEEINNYILLSVSTRFIRDWITSRYLDQILQIIKTYKKNLTRIEFKIIEKSTQVETQENINAVEKSENVSFIKDTYLQYNRIDPNKRFDNFITGTSNKLAYEASLKVSENISHYNPLYLYGGVGMGKTHLLNSIGISLKDKNKVMFISAERFMYQFVKSLKSNDMVKFKEYFRNTDILIIDDIQFMNGKEAMQEEFFHTFNALLDKGSQIIICDPLSNKALNVWKNSSCIASLPFINWISSIIKISVFLKYSLNFTISLDLSDLTNWYINLSAEINITLFLSFNEIPMEFNK